MYFLNKDKKMKKSIYDTPEMEIVALRRELDDVKSLHQKESDILRDNACNWGLREIFNKKNQIEVLRKQKQAIVNEIDKLQPALF